MNKMTMKLKNNSKNIAMIIVVFLFVLCSCNKTVETKRKPIAVEKDGKETYLFKVDGLQDSLVSDSIWKMVFKYKDDIDKMLISKLDSSVIITIEPKNLDAKELATEIEIRGGKVLN
jgi:hypothetical protein